MSSGQIKKILFVSHDLSYTGSPRSLLRMCKVARKIGYEPIVWSRESGGFLEEFKKNDFNVRIVEEASLTRNDMIVNEIKTYSLAVCNTIVVDPYVKLLSRYIPTIWFIREARNIENFINGNPERLRLLTEFQNIFCVSEYAKTYIEKFARYPVRVVHNCIEDLIQYMPTQKKDTEKVRFVQFAALVKRKGYDVLIEAFRQLSKEYSSKCELYFAGLMDADDIYSQRILQKIKDVENIHYLGLITDEREKVKIISSMDVMIVASLDESCSLSALEGCMLSKAMIVTENVGAKYMVSDENGKIVRTADVEEMKNAIMWMIDHSRNLEDMGKISRKFYLEKASMSHYEEVLKNIFSDFIKSRISLETRINTFEYIFPYHLFSRNEKIVLFGSSVISSQFCFQAKNYGDVEIIGVVDDIGCEKFFHENIMLYPIAYVRRLLFDSILITLECKEDALTVEKKLISIGIPKKKIKWHGDIYNRNSYWNWYISNLRFFQEAVPVE